MSLETEVGNLVTQTTALVATVTNAIQVAAINTDVQAVEARKNLAIDTEIPAALETLKAFTSKGAWTASTVYAIKDLVSEGGSWYVCVTPHTSSALFSTDSFSNWRLYQGVTLGDLAAPSGSAMVGHPRIGVGTSPRTLQNKLMDSVSLEDFGADPTGVTDSSAAINAALAYASVVTGTGTYLADFPIVIDGKSKTLILNNLTISAPVKFTDGENCYFEVNNFNVSNTFPQNGNMLENGTESDLTRSYNFNAKIRYVTGKSKDGVIRANVVRNHRCTFSSWNIVRSLNTKNVYTCIPDVALADNTVYGNLIENCDYAMYLWGKTSNTHVEHHVLKYAFVAGAGYGVIYARDEAHYFYAEGAFDFNGRNLLKLALSGPTTYVLDDVITSSSGAWGVITAIIGNEVLVVKGGGVFATGESIEGLQVLAVQDFNTDGYLDFISQTNANYARHTVIASYITNIFGNNANDWYVVSAEGNGPKRANIAGHLFSSGPEEQIISIIQPRWKLQANGINVIEITPSSASLRTASLGNNVEVISASGNTFTTSDANGNRLITWDTATGLVLGAWQGQQYITAARNLKLEGGHFSPHIILGNHHIWVDDAGKLRISDGQPQTNTAGVVVGTQA